MIDTMRTYLRDHESNMFDLLERLVNINSHSENREGVNRVVDVLESVMNDMGFTTKRLTNERTGDNLVAENAIRAERGGGPLLVGHMDTVFPPDMGFDTFRRDGNTIYGPGVVDMKGGLVIGIYALKALMAAGYDTLPMAFFFNADEEIGSPHSRDLIVEEAKKSAYCFVMEDSGRGGGVIVGRKGRCVFDLTVTGKPAHAGDCGYPKPSAIVEMAHKIARLEALNDPESGTSVNVGLVEGGVGPNTVAARCTARVETRHMNTESRDRVWTEIEAIAATSTLDGTTGTIDILTSRPPMVTNDTILDLYAVVESAGKAVGIPTNRVRKGGGSDANTVSQAGIPALDGMGPSGGALHTPDEYIHADCMTKQALLTAASIIEAADRY